MKKNKFSYTTENHLASLLMKRKYELTKSKGEEVYLSEVEEELADYCELKRKSVMDIKRGINQASLPVAMKMAEFFNVSVETIFELKNKEDIMREKAERIKMLMRQLDNEVLSDLHEAMEEYLDEVKSHFPDIAYEENSTYENVHDFYMNLPASGYIDDARGWMDNLQDKVEAEKKLNDRMGY